MHERQKVLTVEHAENPDILEYSDGQLPRFILPEDGQVVLDYRFIQSQLAGAMAADPKIVGATAFGSTVKGYADPERSDIDVTVFVDADKLGLSMREALTSSDHISFSDWHGFDRDRASRAQLAYKGIVSRLLKQQHNGLLPNLPINAEVYPIGHDYLKRLAEFEISNAALDARYRELHHAGDQLTEVDQLANWAAVSTDSEVLQRIPGLVDRMTADEKRNGINVLAVRAFLGRVAAEENSEFARMRLFVFSEGRLTSSLPMRLFSLALTSGLAPYRRTFLERLAEAPDPGVAYTYFINRLKVFENSPTHPRDTSKIPYPATLAEALKVYG